MNTLILISILVLCTLGVSFLIWMLLKCISFYKRQSLDFSNSMTINNMPIITLNYKDRELNFLIDSGSNISLINSLSLKRMVVETNLSMISIGGIGGAIEKAIHLKLVLHKNKTLYECEFYTSNMENTFKQVGESGVHIDGIIGNDFLLKNKIIIDYDKQLAYTR